MPEKITVSNGREIYRIPATDLDDASRDGFYRPFERGQTVVGNGDLVFEIPLTDLPAATKNGLRELLTHERQAWDREQHSPVAPTREAPQPNRRAEVKSESDVTKDTAKHSPSSGTDDQSGLAAATLPEVVLAGLNQAELAEQERQQQIEQELSEAVGWRRYLVWLRIQYEQRRVALSRQARGTAISAAVHVALILILASLILNTEEPKGLLLSAAPSSDTVVDEVILEPTPIEITEPTESTESESPAESEVVKAETAVLPDFSGAIKGDAIKPPALPDSSGSGQARPMKRASFFGKRVAAVDYVFVIDNSNSMTGGRFETALNELMIAVNQLTPKQRFFVLFYSDTAYPMFHPKPAQQLMPATPRNKELLRQWLTTVQLCLQTNGKEAITAAFALEPDVIFVLGDGAFTDKTSEYFAAMPQNKIPLHTLGMEVKPNDAAAFEKLALAHGGTYKDVGVAPGAKELFQTNPRPRNSVRGPVWGLKLKPKPN